MKLTKNLSLEEYMPPEIIKSYGDRAIRLLDDRVVKIDQALRERYGIIYINSFGLNYRGYRPDSYYKNNPNSQSQHRYGRASDKHFKDIGVDEVYADILKNQQYWLGLGLTTMENIKFTKSKGKTGWLHTDVRYTNMNQILIVNP